MERNLREVFQEAAQLPERDRATLAGLLIETLDPVSEPDVEVSLVSRDQATLDRDRRWHSGIDPLGRSTFGIVRPHRYRKSIAALIPFSTCLSSVEFNSPIRWVSFERPNVVT